MLNTVKPATFNGQHKPEGFLARQADAMVTKVENVARQAHLTMDEMKTAGTQFDMKA